MALVPCEKEQGVEDVKSDFTFLLEDFYNRATCKKYGKIVIVTFQLKGNLTQNTPINIFTIANNSKAIPVNLPFLSTVAITNPSTGAYLGSSQVFSSNGQTFQMNPSVTASGAAVVGQMVWNVA